MTNLAETQTSAAVATEGSYLEYAASTASSGMWTLLKTGELVVLAPAIFRLALATERLAKDHFLLAKKYREVDAQKEAFIANLKGFGLAGTTLLLGGATVITGIHALNGLLPGLWGEQVLMSVEERRTYCNQCGNARAKPLKDLIYKLLQIIKAKKTQ